MKLKFLAILGMSLVLTLFLLGCAPTMGKYEAPIADYAPTSAAFTAPVLATITTPEPGDEVSFLSAHSDFADGEGPYWTAVIVSYEVEVQRQSSGVKMVRAAGL